MFVVTFGEQCLQSSQCSGIPLKLTANSPQNWCFDFSDPASFLGAFGADFQGYPAPPVWREGMPSTTGPQLRWKEPPPGDSSRDLFIPDRWRSLSYWKGSRFHHPKKVTSRIARVTWPSGVFDSKIPHALFGVFGVRGVIGVLGVLASDRKRKNSAIWRKFLKNLAAHWQVTGLPLHMGNAWVTL